MCQHIERHDATGGISMKVYAGMSDRLSLRETGAYAQRIERLGYDGLNIPETVHDALAVSLLALEHTSTLIVRASVILAFPRSPMLTAYTAWDLAEFSNGRFELGLGSQIRQNIEGRFSIPWVDPVAKMDEYVTALRAIWQTFNSGERLNYEGEHYRFTRLQPFFNPGPLSEPRHEPPLWLGGVNSRMVNLAARQADGYLTHPTNSHPRYMTEICRPALAAAGRSVEVVNASPYITGPDRASVDQSRTAQRYVFGFLYSTPAYRRQLELFGWQDLGEQLQALTRSSNWAQLESVITDDVLDALIPQGTWDELPALVETWFAPTCDGVVLQVPADPADDARFAEIIRSVRAIEPTWSKGHQ